MSINVNGTTYYRFGRSTWAAKRADGAFAPLASAPVTLYGSEDATSPLAVLTTGQQPWNPVTNADGGLEDFYAPQYDDVFGDAGHGRQPIHCSELADELARATATAVAAQQALDDLTPRVTTLETAPPPVADTSALQAALDAETANRTAADTNLSGRIPAYVFYDGTTNPPRPAANRVVWQDFPARPAAMRYPDQRIYSDQPFGSNLAQFTFEGGTLGASVAPGSVGSGTDWDGHVTAGTGASKVYSGDVVSPGGGTTVGKITKGTTTGAVFTYWRAAVGDLTRAVLGTWVYLPAVFTSNEVLLRFRLSDGTTNGPTLRVSGSPKKFEVWDAAGVMVVSHPQVIAASTWYYVEVEVDCVAGTLRNRVTLASGVASVAGDLTTTRNTGPTVGDYSVGLMGASLSTVAYLDDVRVRDFWKDPRG